MAQFSINNVKISGMSACVPSNEIENKYSELFGNRYEKLKYIESTGVERRRVVDKDCCTSDLCEVAVEQLLKDLGWEKKEVEALFFVSQTPDYIYPETSCLLQHRLGLSTDCMCMDITMGCPGWVYGVATASSIVSAGKIKKALLLTGDTISRARSPYDRVNLITGDCGTCTSLEYSELPPPIYFDLHTDGGGGNAIIIPDGGFRNYPTLKSHEYIIGEDGVMRTSLQTHMDGTEVFLFAVSKVPKSIKSILEKYKLEEKDIDYFLLHQANKMINTKIVKKLGFDAKKFPLGLKDFGNTSSASIPLLAVSELGNDLKKKRIVASGFGVGLSWGTVYFETDLNMTVSKLIEYKK